MRIGSLRSIYRVNVRFVTALCLICALLAAGWVASRVAAWEPHLPVNPPASIIPPPPAGEWHRSEMQDPVWSDADPFTSPYLEARLAEEEAARAAEEARLAAEAKARAEAAARLREQQAKAKAVAATAAKTKPAAKPIPAPVAVKPKPPRTVTFIYRGMLTRTDGTSVAIIEQADNGKTALLKAGDAIEGFGIARLERTTTVLTSSDGKTEHPLPVGKPVQLIPKNQEP